MKRLLEVCAGSLRSALAAAESGADRIELCSALSLGGLTPSIGLVETVRKQCSSLRIHVLIRPHEHDFVYSPEEIDAMTADIRAMQPYADGFVSGALTEAGDVDVDATCRLREACDGKPFTFHRAFDVCREPSAALGQLIRIGCTRLLTSGQQPSACQGVDLIRRLVTESAGRIIVMPGAGVSSRNAEWILRQTGAMEIHGSAKADGPETDPAEVAAIRQALARLG